MLNRSQERLVVIVAAIGMFLSTLDTGIINVALPFFRSYFKYGCINGHWIHNEPCNFYYVIWNFK